MPEGWINVFDAQRDAERKLAPGACGYFSGGAGDELTPRENVSAWQGRRPRRRQLTGVESSTSAATVLVGRPTAWGLAPAGSAGAERVLGILTAELEPALALLGLASPAEAGPGHPRRALPTRVYSEDVVPGNSHS